MTIWLRVLKSMVDNALADRAHKHYSDRAGWLRAAVLGANDGIVSTASFIIGVHASGATQETILLAGFLTLIAGAVSMAAGEFVSVSSQADIEHADLQMESESLAKNTELELKELTEIYCARGLKPELAAQVAQQLTAHNALEAHARDEIGITETTKANPLVAAFSSALAFVLGSILPLISAWIVPVGFITWVTGLSSLLTLGLLGALSAYLGGASIIKATMRVVIWGCLAMLITGFVGSLIEVPVI